MSIVIATMAVIVLVGTGVLGFVFMLHVGASSPMLRARARRWVVVAAAQFYATRRAAGQRLRPVAVKVRQRLRDRGVAEVEKVPAQSSSRA